MRGMAEKVGQKKERLWVKNRINRVERSSGKFKPGLLLVNKRTRRSEFYPR